MAKTRPSKSKSKSKSKSSKKSVLNTTGSFSSNPLAAAAPSPEPDAVAPLLAAATALLHDQSSPTEALAVASHALSLDPDNVPTLELLAEIQTELGDVASAYDLYSRAATLAPSTGPEKFLWLAQLTPDGGESAVAHYTTAVSILRSLLATPAAAADAERALPKKLVSALCGLAELYMSDLCMAPDAEARCEAYVAEALLAVPDSCEALQTLASVRISQQRPDDAVAALQRALAAQGGESYATRIALAKLCIETEMYDAALEVLEALQAEDDTLPDLWYLGGWTLVLLGERVGAAGKVAAAVEEEDDDEDASKEETWAAAREWLLKCRKLCAQQEWEDEGIMEHTEELLAQIAAEIGEVMEEVEAVDDGEAVDEAEWESDSGDDEMKDS
ncbi:hypothetical protein EDC01DRAFT_668236 [Geopyxis carbonaria]|nr:hypothetical protein EDC01DRAFT_668236 [Geopyxis carbonaria]